MLNEGVNGLIAEAEFIDAEYIDAEYAKYVRASNTQAKKHVDWMFWVVLAALAMVVYTAAYLFQAHPAVQAARDAAAPATQLDLHDCTLPEVKADLAHPGGPGHDFVVPYAHSTCREGDVRLWEATH